MMLNREVRDLLVLVADSQMKRTVETLLGNRRPALGIREITFEVQSHPHQDSGCRTASEGILRPLRDEYQYALVMFDYDGCGVSQITAPDLERNLEQFYETNGWTPGSVVFVVIEPELEAWMFGASFQQLQQFVGWSHTQDIREWLIRNGYLSVGNHKPDDPKSAIEAILDLQREPRSRRLYEYLARTVSLARCQDRAFQKFRTTLQRWFPTQ